MPKREAAAAQAAVAATAIAASGGAAGITMAEDRVARDQAAPVLEVRAPGQVAQGTTISASESHQSTLSGQAPGSAPAALAWGLARWPLGQAAIDSRWRAALPPLLLVALALLLSVPRLTTPDRYVFDELYYAYTAGRYVAGQEAYSTAIPPTDDPAIEWTHPPLAKLLIAGGILLAGDNPLGWRIINVLFGALGVVVAYFLAFALTGSRLVSGLAAALLLLNGLYLVESRTGMSNLFLLVFSSGALLAFAHLLNAPPERIGPWLVAIGLCLGLAIATKWSALALAGLIGLAVGWRMAQCWRHGRRAELRAYLRWAPLALLLPVALYLASYAHFFLTGHTWADFVQLHRDMFHYHRNLGVVHDDSSPWWQWPLAARGVWYFAAERRHEIAVVFGNGNPLLYWPMVVAVAWVAIDWWGRKPGALLVLLIGFFGQWLPWALSPRGTFIYHFLPSVPLGCLAIAVILSNGWWQGGLARGAAVLYGVATIATFLFFYPVYTAMPLSPEAFALRMWLPSWR